MKFQNILLLLTACLLAGSCSDDANDGAWFLPRTHQVMDATTDAPTPIISPTPVLMRNSGAVMLTAASASLPMPRPTKIPSVITKTAEKTIPRTVGISSFRKSFGISMLPKSILSFIAFVFWSAKILASGRAKVNIW